MLSAPERTRLETRLAERERATGAQMVIAVFPSLEGESLEDVSIRLAEKWKVGKKGVDNGVILVVFLKERKLRIEVGYGLESVITDAVSTVIIRDALAPRFREQRYAAGLEAAVDAVYARVGGGVTTGREPERTRALDDFRPGSVAFVVVLFLLLLGVVFVLPLYLMTRLFHRALTLGRQGWDAHAPIGWRSGGGGFSGGGGSSSGGSSGGGGGFSGGGGSFGGGGASGDW